MIPRATTPKRNFPKYKFLGAAVVMVLLFLGVNFTPNDTRHHRALPAIRAKATRKTSGPRSGSASTACVQMNIKSMAEAIRSAKSAKKAIVDNPMDFSSCQDNTKYSLGHWLREYERSLKTGSRGRSAEAFFKQNDAKWKYAECWREAIPLSSTKQQKSEEAKERERLTATLKEIQTSFNTTTTMPGIMNLINTASETGTKFWNHVEVLPPKLKKSIGMQLVGKIRTVGISKGHAYKFCPLSTWESFGIVFVDKIPLSQRLWLTFKQCSSPKEVKRLVKRHKKALNGLSVDEKNAIGTLLGRKSYQKSYRKKINFLFQTH